MAFLDEITGSVGKKTRLYRLLYLYGPGNGKALFLPIDQGLEHGPRDFFANPESANPEFQLKVALEGGFSGIVFQPGLAMKYMRDYAGLVPLILKINGKTNIPPDDEAFSSLTATVEDAVRLGADAIGYTLYVGSPAQDRDFAQFREVRRQAEKLGMPVIVWSYPRGRAIEAKGGRNSLYAVEYAARVALELGADMVKVNIPVLDKDRAHELPPPYNELVREITLEKAMERVITAAGKIPVIIAGGGKVDDEELLRRARICVKAGAIGFIFGRNIWQRPHHEALEIARRLKEVLLEG